jgi:GNAT superfamily N-acetyltransferase
VASVRRATAADLDALVELGQALHAESPQYRDEPFEAPVLRRWLAARIATNLMADDSAVFVCESGGALVGVLVALVFDRSFNRRRAAAELCLYVVPAHRGGRALPRLATAFEGWAAKHGASTATLGISTGIHPERTVRAYTRMGYTLDGHHATKAL